MFRRIHITTGSTNFSLYNRPSCSQTIPHNRGRFNELRLRNHLLWVPIRIHITYFPGTGHIPSSGLWTADSPLTQLFFGCRPDSSRNIIPLHKCAARAWVFDRSLSISASADDYLMNRPIAYGL